MTINVGILDRLVRLILGVILVSLPFVTSLVIFDATWIKIASVLIGAVLLVTALASRCPLYSIFGIRTCRTK